MTALSRDCQERLIQWAVFGVAISLIPFGFRWVLFDVTSRPLALNELISQGELLLISTALAATAIGDVISVHPRLQTRALIVGGLSLITVITGASYYALVNAGLLKTDHVVRTSLALFIFSLIGGCTSIVAAEQSKVTG